jgi:hypothetical protein
VDGEAESLAKDDKRRSRWMKMERLLDTISKAFFVILPIETILEWLLESSGGLHMGLYSKIWRFCAKTKLQQDL